MTSHLQTWIELLRRQIRRGGLALLLSGLALAAPGVRAQDAGGEADPGSIVTTLHEKLIEIMNNSAELGYAGRYRVMEPVVLSSFDTPLIVKVILSRYWNELDEPRRNAFIGIFNRLSIATYASRFKDYDGEQFSEVAREQLKNERLMIRTELHRPDDEPPVKLDYLMQRTGGGRWLIISVIANGVSDLSLKRAEYAVVIKERGFDSLVEDIEQKIKQLEAEAQN